MKSMALTPILIFYSCLAGIPWPEVRPSPQTADGDRSKLVGAWLCTKRVTDGREVLPATNFEEQSWLVIEDERYVVLPIVWGRPSIHLARVWDISLDPRSVPKSIDLTFRNIGDSSRKKFEGKELKNGIESREGIYVLTRDRLITCVGSTRPMAFSAPAGSSRTYEEYRRVEPQGPAARPSPLAANELTRLAGTWVPIQEIEGGEPVPSETLRWKILKIEGNRFITGEIDKDGRPVFEKERFSELAPDPTHEPKLLDIVQRPRIVSRWVVEGIYQCDGDILTICTGSRTRPTGFTAPAGTDRSLTVYRRVDADNKGRSATKKRQ